jgi:serine/threonine-protein kinase
MPPAGDAGADGGSPRHIGRYRVLERIGQGAMGTVFAADDPSLGRLVAIKVMTADLAEEPEIRERFYREAKVTGQLAHRNIVTVFDLGEHDGHPYIAMELLSGLSLPEFMATDTARSIDTKLDLMMQMCEGLQAAHTGGVVHRDIKPSNLFVLRDGTLKILDFGVARLADSNLTMGGFVVGTPEYMSPEQAQGRVVDARSDIFSAAGVGYFMLAGRSPFASSDLPTMLQNVMHEPPAPLTEAQAPSALQRVLAKALAKDPAQRYGQCAEMLADLQQVRRAFEGAAHRVTQAALDRYRQILALLDEQRALARTLGIAGRDAYCDQAAARLAADFPFFAKHARPGALLPSLDREQAADALAGLQDRHNAALAGLQALRDEAADAIHPDAPASAAPVTGAEAPGSVRDRAGAIWRRLKGES